MRVRTRVGALLISAAAIAAPLTATVAASASTASPAQAAKVCTIRWTQTLVQGNAGNLKLTFSATCGHSVSAKVKCEANNGSSSTIRYGGSRTTPGSSTAGCFNGSYPQHGWMHDNTTATDKSIF